MEDDPADWPISFQEMRRLDNLLRCSICYEFFNIAMMVSQCSHNYCSLCIRKHLTYQMQCPTCSNGMKESDLKCNRVLDELVICFRSVRRRLLSVVRASFVDKIQGLEVNNVTPVRTEKNQGSSSENVCDTPENLSPKQISPERTNKKRKRLYSSSFKDSEDEFVSSPSTSNTSLNRSSTQIEGKESNKVSCPVCSKLLAANAINSHLDLCLVKVDRPKRNRKSHCTSTESRSCKATVAQNSKSGSDVAVRSLQEQCSQNTGFSSSTDVNFGRTMIKSGSNQFISGKTTIRQPLPKMIYNIMTEKQLKKKLKEHKLSTKGDRKSLTARLKQFTLLYNSQCDAMSPLSVEEITRQVNQLETQQSKLKGQTTLIHTFDRTKTEEEKKLFNLEYLKTHTGHFEDLIKDIRSRKEKAILRDSQNDENKLENIQESGWESSVSDGGVIFSVSPKVSCHQSTKGDENSSSNTQLNEEHCPDASCELTGQPNAGYTPTIIDLVDTSDEYVFSASVPIKSIKTPKTSIPSAIKSTGVTTNKTKKGAYSISAQKRSSSNKSKSKNKPQQNIGKSKSSSTIGSYFNKNQVFSTQFESEVKDSVLHFSNTSKLNKSEIEDDGSGSSLIQELGDKNTGENIYSDDESRASKDTFTLQSTCIPSPPSASSLEFFESE